MKWRSALKPGGQLMIIVPTMWEEHQMPHDYYRFTRYGAQRLLEEAGFAVDQIRPLGGYFWFMGRKFIDVLEFFERCARVLLWPFLAIPFGFLLPILCTHLDWLDRDKYYTIGQLCFCRRVREPGTARGRRYPPVEDSNGANRQQLIPGTDRFVSGTGLFASGNPGRRIAFIGPCQNSSTCAKFCPAL